MPSNLTFASTQAFRDRLLTRNLLPYRVPGVYAGQPVQQIVQEYTQSDYSIIDSPDQLISNDPFADSLYPLNQFGPNGGFNKTINIGGLANTRSNQGPYDYLDAKLPQLSAPIELHLPTQNKYSSSNPLQLISINNIQSVPTFKQYADPLNFTPSTYSPYEILMENNPNGDNGTLSQDSYIVQLGAKQLQKLFRDRIAQSINEKTIGRLNLLNAVGNPIQAIMIAQGKVPLIEKDWTITRPSNIALRATNFLARLGGFYYPGSVIPGDYWTADQQNLSSFGQIARAFNGGRDPRASNFGKLFGRFLSQPSPSQLFLDNTGAGTKNQLYYNLSFNRYSPQYKKSIINTIFTNALSRINDALDIPQKGGYYVGHDENTVSTINSPPGELPVNSFGQEVQSPVYGQDKLSKEYEGDSLGNKFQFGLAGYSSTDGNGVGGGFIWTASKYNRPGYNQGPLGVYAPVDDEYKQNEFNNTIEKNLTVTIDGAQFPFRAGSILDQTQRILESTPHTSGRLAHAGNAINQLSKVFNDGYKEITKGSQVVGYTNAEGLAGKGVVKPTNVYCRVFAKDTPYYTYADLQKTDGNIRKFDKSVLDSTYDLNIAPVRNKNFFEDTGVKKYMFSLENLAWRTSNRVGLTVNDLPACEKGPNGGRIMWFPPYDIKLSETTTPSFKGQDFLGRPEPVYTYTNTKRSGQLSWKIIVDHPSILNVIAQKEVNGTKPETNKIIDSFIAGCLKYDIYELAKRWPSLSVNELFSLQEIVVQNKNIINEETIKQIQTEIPNSAEETPQVIQQPKTPPNFNKYTGYAYYFDNNIPTDSTSNWDNLYQTYIGQQTTYQQNSATNDQKNATGNFFTSAITFNYEITNELYSDIQKFFTDFAPTEGEQSPPSLSIELVGSASAVASNSYNLSLSERRIQSVINYLQQSSPLAQYFTKGWIKITNTTPQGEDTTVFPITRGGANSNEGIKSPVAIDCTKLSKNPTLYEKKYSPNAMACRRVSISNIFVSVPEPKKTTPEPVNNKTEPTKYSTETQRIPTTRVETTSSTKIIQNERKKGLTKRVLRKLLSECDYFSEILKSNPMFYDSMKERLKYFNPAFHSMTPEGLNSRLTFLQQCMRPGDTIPVINSKGVAEYNNSVNTAFGAPPVLVLRIGDFFNTKIIPQSLQISYEPLLFDLNPEGIGVQPMLANITMSFEIVGGEGLQGPIDKLQNALSFNFYANTEMYDERADETDTSYPNYDEFLWNKILEDTPLVGVNDLNNQIDNGGGNTIGEIQTKFFNNAGTSGETIFRKIMDDFHSCGQEYINTFYNKTSEVIENYNLPILSMFLTNMLYNEGSAMDFTGPQFLKIFGKSNSYQENVDILFDSIVEDINGQTSSNPQGNGLIFSYYNENFPEKKVINIIKKNLITQVNKNREVVKNYLTGINNDMTNIQQSLVKIMAKLDVVDTLTDGYIKSNQSVQILNLTPTTGATIPIDTANELSIDYSSGATQLYSFYQLFENSGIINTNTNYNFFNPYIMIDPGSFTILTCGVCTDAEKRFFVGMFNVLKNPITLKNFMNSVLTPDVSNVYVGAQSSEVVFSQYFVDRYPIYEKEWNKEKKFFSDNFLTVYETNYKTWTPFVKGKERRCAYDTYTQGTTTQEDYIKNLYKDGNSNTDPSTFNGKNKFN